MAVKQIATNMRDQKAWGGGGRFPEEDCLCTYSGKEPRYHTSKTGSKSMMLTLLVATYVSEEAVAAGQVPFEFERDYNLSIPGPDDKQAGKWKALFQASRVWESLLDENGEECAWCMVFDDETCEVGYQLLNDDGSPYGDYVLVPPEDFTGYLYWHAAPPRDQWPTTQDKEMPDGSIRKGGVIQQYGEQTMLTAAQVNDILAGTWTPNRPGGSKAKTAAGAAAAAGTDEVGRPAAAPALAPARQEAAPSRAAPAATGPARTAPTATGPSRAAPAAPAAAPAGRQPPPAGPAGRPPRR